MKICPVCQREFAAGATHCNDDGVALVAMTTGAGMRPEELVGQVVDGRYRVERIVGKGGMGTVYACRHVVVGKVLAMKVLKAGIERSDGVLQRFIREAQTANMLRSRHIAEVGDFGQLANGSFYVTMELLEGHDLAHAMRHRLLDRAKMIHVFTQVAETLAIAHEKGIVHRDLKPDNVFLVNEDGDPTFVKLLDFGIAKVTQGDGPQGLTETGVILGTPYYMSPEQARAEAIDHRSDIYSLGVMMYRAFTGRLPFMADSTMGVLTRHLTEVPELPSRIVGTVDPATEQMILKCMEKRRESRYQSMREIADTLRQLAAGQTAAAAPMQPAGAYATDPRAASAAMYTSPGPTGPHAAAYRHGAPATGAHPVAHPSGAYAGAYASGAYQAAAAPAAYPSGAHQPPPVAYPSGAHQPPPIAYPSGAHQAAPMTAPSGAYQAAQAPGIAPPVDTTGLTRAPAPIGGEIGTTRGYVASPEPPAPPPRSSIGLLVGIGVALLSTGALVAVLLMGRGGNKDAPALAAPASSPAAPASAAPSSTAAPAETASAAAAPTSSAAPAVASATAAAKPRPGAPPPKPSATATAANPPKRLPTDIRSPFE